MAHVVNVVAAVLAAAVSVVVVAVAVVAAFAGRPVQVVGGVDAERAAGGFATAVVIDSGRAQALAGTEVFVVGEISDAPCLYKSAAGRGTVE